MTNYVYRAYDRADSLLYVGVTNDLDRRLDAHSKQSGWWIFKARIESDAYPTRAEAEAEEKRLIQEAHPRWNRAHRVAGPAGIVERHKVEEHVWQQLNRLNTRRTNLLSDLEKVENELRVLAFAIEGMSGGGVDEDTPADRKRAALHALKAGESA